MAAVVGKVAYCQSIWGKLEPFCASWRTVLGLLRHVGEVGVVGKAKLGGEWG